MSRLDPFRRGSVWRVRLDPVEGSEQGGTRPVVIISSDLLNAPLPVVTVDVITMRKTERVFATEVLVEPTEGGLTQRSKVLLYQTRTISKSRLVEELGAPSTVTMDASIPRCGGLWTCDNWLARSACP
jgi:mRNA interferase MazF